MQSRNAGFTLIELSIVLVIIGLIVGGVLVGQDLIRAAEVRATISQIEKYNTAVNTFYGKFGAIPGDMNNTVANQFGFSSAVHNGNSTIAGEGDGNGVIDSPNGGPQSLPIGNLYNQLTTFVTLYGETEVFWQDLSSDVAGHLIDGNFNSGTEATYFNGVSGSALSLYIPAAKLGRGNYFYVAEINNVNYFGITGVVAFSPNIGGQTSMTVAQAYGIDKKIDDGYPTTGTVAAIVPEHNPWFWAIGGPVYPGDTYTPSGSLFSGIVATAGNPSSALTCFDAQSGTQPSYSMEQNSGAGPNCALVIRFQ